ncbi:amino acid permease [Thermoleophilia bacterium SCSIO 60948]|nr:amino acid permease [Thermoleophilia bacterium SCSIO 60948]
MTDSKLFVRKPVEQLVQETKQRGEELKRDVGALDLTALGIGAIIGTGIFVIIGEAIGLSGPAIILAFVLAGVTCIFSALSYAELASTIPISGSAYTYGYATLGEFAAWIIGWDLLIEYGLGVATVAVGWGEYLSALFADLFSFSLPDAIALAPGEGGVVNLPAVLLIAAITALLIYGVRETARANAIMVVIKIGILLVFIALGLTAFDGGNMTPFAPEGFPGIESAAALIFFAYIGFDAVSTSGEEAKNPGRDLPIAIVGSLVFATILYIIVATVAVGTLPADQLAGAPAPLATALSEGSGLQWGATLISFGALIAITSVVLTLFYGQTRVAFSMSRDGLLPRGLAKLTARKTPIVLTLLFGALSAVLAALLPLSELAELVNIGTLFAFLIVNLGVIILRRTQPDLKRGFRVPFSPVFPLIGAALCIYLMTKLPIVTWERFGIWMGIGVLIYVFYGRRHSLARRGTTAEAESNAG